MTPKEANEIIKEYSPHEGFFDLSIKPSALTKMEYAKILKTQNFLADQNMKKSYIKEFYPNQWDKLRELSAQLQQEIFQYWGDSVFQS